MALLFLDGFEDYNAITDMTTYDSNVLPRWVHLNHFNGAISTAQTRTPQPTGVTAKSLYSSLNDSMALGMILPSVTTIIVGFAFYPGKSDREIMYFSSVATPNRGDNLANGVGIRIDASNKIVIRREDTDAITGTSSSTLTLNTWYYLEIKYTFSTGSAGAIEVKINGTSEISLSGINSSYGSTGIVYLYLKGQAVFYDDLYVCDTNGSSNNDFLGSVKVCTTLPDGNGSTTQMTASAGSNWQCVDEIPPNTTDYVEATAANQTDLYSMLNIPVGETATTVPGAMVVCRSVKANGENIKFQMATKDASNIAYSAGLIVSSASTYRTTFAIFEKQPDGSTAWDRTSIDAAEIGLRSI